MSISTYKNLKDEINQSFLKNKTSSSSYLAKHTQITDQLLIELFSRHITQKNCTLISLGGYGRCELYPYSDIDILILQNENSLTAENVSPFLQKLWDLGLRVGHAVRTVNQCLTICKEDIVTQTAILESRFLCGDENLFDALCQQSSEQLNLRSFIRAKNLEQNQRHHRYHNIDSSLEPNIKESPGGLREIHILGFIDRAISAKENYKNKNFDFIKNWQNKNWLSEIEAEQLNTCIEFLQSLRIHLHLLRSRLNDKLLFDYQDSLAKVLGYHQNDTQIDFNLRPAEQLMKEYYRLAMQNLQINKLLIASISEQVFDKNIQSKNSEYQVLEFGLGLNDENELIVLDSEEFASSPEHCLKPYLCLYKGIANNISVELKRLISTTSGQISEYSDNEELKQDFIELLKLPVGVISTLRELNRLGFLGAYIKPFGRIVGQMQYDLYHAYTVDQHTLMVIRNLRRYMLSEFKHDYPEHSKVMAKFEKPWLLLIAALFHDVAKGRGGNHSKLGALDAREFCIAHHLADKDSKLIEWLVSEHLLMSRIAQSADLSDAQTIQDFCEKVRSVRYLDALYLLTAADIRGTAPGVWTPWKGKLLSSLYSAAKEYFKSISYSNSNNLEYEDIQQTSLELLTEGLKKSNWSDDEIQRITSELTEDYLSAFTDEESLWHIEELEKLPPPYEGQLNIAFRHIAGSLDNEFDDNFLQLMIISDSKRSQEIFSRTCGHLSYLNFSVMKAQSALLRKKSKPPQNIFHFEIENDNSEINITPSFLVNLQKELQTLLAQDDSPNPIFTRTPRLLLHSRFKPQTRIMLDASNSQYIISISTADRLGLVYDLARHFAKFRARLISAHINTLGARAENSFLIECPQLFNTNILFEFEEELLEILSICQ